jgi:hypothetical protein
MRARAQIAAFLFAFGFAHGDVTTFPVKPSETDPNIHTFDFLNWVYINRDIVVDHHWDLPADRRQLLLWLTGTGGEGHDAQGFSNLAANLGYHVITLAYPDSIPASICDVDPDPDNFEKFRMAIIQGGEAHRGNGRVLISVERPESIENRLIKILQRLQQLRPRENWGQFLNEDGSIKWESIAVAGQSQGGGHAALIGIKHSVARVICFGAPKDYSVRFNAPANWYKDRSATPKDRFFAFNHTQDPMGCTPEQLFENLLSLGLGWLGQRVDVTTTPFPFDHSHILYTSYPAVSIVSPGDSEARRAHGAAVNTRNAEKWEKVWTYLLTEGDSAN